MKDLDELFDVQESFIRFLRRDFEYTEELTCDNNGKERSILKVSNGFFVELTNQRNVPNSANLRCWWHTEENAVEVNSEYELLYEFMDQR